MSESALPHSSLHHAGSRVAHHFDSMDQQFNASKLGMWLFLATELLLFSGLFCLYAVYRGNHPEIFEYGHRYLDTNWGAINTIVLILSSFTMAMAVRCAQTNQRHQLILYLGLTFLLALDFMGIKTIEYTHKIRESLMWGTHFAAVSQSAPVAETSTTPAPGEPSATQPAPAAAPPPAALQPGNKDKGRPLFRGTCASCHGPGGQGMPGLGKDMRNSAFIAEREDMALVDFLKVGRMPTDPSNSTGKLMPPRGGNTALSDQDLMDIVAFVRQIQQTSGDGKKRESAAASLPSTSAKEGKSTTEQDPSPPAEEVVIEKSFILPAPEGPQGLAKVQQAHSGSLAHPRLDPRAPANVQTFFAIYFLLTGLHGLHVLIGMVVIGWLLVRAVYGEFGSHYFTPVDLGGLYWHLVDVIWIFLFPLLYLIR
jgi:cytochrome c oxidase subunit 3